MSISDREVRIVSLIDAERRRQDEIWGWPQDKTIPEWMTILGEEFGEACQAGNQIYFDHSDETDGQDLVTELIQVAAVVVSALLDLAEQNEVVF